MTTRPTDTPYTTNKRTIMDGNSTSQASKRLATIVAVLTLALGLPTTRSQAAGVWTNEPAGASVVMDCPFNSVSGCGILDVYSSSQIISDGTAQVSASNVMKSTLYAGNSTGGMQLNYAIPKTYREMFVGLMWRTNPQFQGRSGGNKLFFMRGPDSIGVFVIQGGLSGPRLRRTSRPVPPTRLAMASCGGGSTVSWPGIIRI
jgi:hypothetical protein